MRNRKGTFCQERKGFATSLTKTPEGNEEGSSLANTEGMELPPQKGQQRRRTPNSTMTEMAKKNQEGRGTVKQNEIISKNENCV